jgi:hypothetical protein
MNGEAVKVPSRPVLGNPEVDPLVVHTKFASGPSGQSEALSKEIEQNNWYSGMISSRYQLKDRAAELLPGFRVNTACMLPIIPNRQFEIWKDRDTDRTHIHGVARCGSVWVCPVCASKISVGRREEVREALDVLDRLGLKVLFVTLTASHSRKDKLGDLFDRFKSAKRYMRAGRKWQDVKGDYLVKGSISATEMTWGFSNGWHVHFHEIMIIGGVVEAGEVEARLYTLWSDALAREGLECSREHGVKALPGTEKVGDYITKWGLEHEITSLEKAGKNGNFTPFQLLALYDQGEAWAGGLFQEYADVTKGRVSLRWSRGLRDMLGMSKGLTDQELAEAEDGENSFRMVRLTRSEYMKILYSGRPGVMGEMLAVAKAGREALLIWLAELFDVHPEVPP